MDEFTIIKRTKYELSKDIEISVKISLNIKEHDIFSIEGSFEGINGSYKTISAEPDEENNYIIKAKKHNQL